MQQQYLHYIYNRPGSSRPRPCSIHWMHRETSLIRTAHASYSTYTMTDRHSSVVPKWLKKTEKHRKQTRNIRRIHLKSPCVVVDFRGMCKCASVERKLHSQPDGFRTQTTSVCDWMRIGANAACACAKMMIFIDDTMNYVWVQCICSTCWGFTQWFSVFFLFLFFCSSTFVHSCRSCVSRFCARCIASSFEIIQSLLTSKAVVIRESFHGRVYLYLHCKLLFLMLFTSRKRK